MLAVAIYQAQYIGVMGKLGLYRDSGEVLFDHNAIVRERLSDGFWQQCESSLGLGEAVRYYLASGEEKINLGWYLGGQRLICGLNEAVDSDPVKATYKIVRGLRYMEQSLILTAEQTAPCTFLPSEDIVSRVERVVELSRGSARVAIGKVEERVHERYSLLQERCIDQDSETN